MLMCPDVLYLTVYAGGVEAAPPGLRAGGLQRRCHPLATEKPPLGAAPHLRVVCSQPVHNQITPEPPSASPVNSAAEPGRPCHSLHNEIVARCEARSARRSRDWS